MKPVNDINFWKQRLDDAKTKYPLHYSVFITNQNSWNTINKNHKDILQKEIKSTDKVIDLGCAYGRSSEMFDCKEYVGVDFSPDFINEAKKLYPNKKFQVADLKSLPFKDKYFDVGFMVSIKAMIKSNLGKSEWELMEKECKRVCKKVLILEYGIGDLGIDENSNEYEII
jgi:SAM-dependent methyltransferase